jgi:hypothetical protein
MAVRGKLSETLANLRDKIGSVKLDLAPIQNTVSEQQLSSPIWQEIMELQ